MVKNAAKVAALRAGAGGLLEFRPGADAAELEKQVARILLAVQPALQYEADPMAGSACLASSFVAYAAEKLPAAGPAKAWEQVLEEVLADAGTALDDDEPAAAVGRTVSEMKRRGVLAAPQATLEVGAMVVALLTEDDDWHEAVIQKDLGGGRFQVLFLEYGKPQEAAAEDIRPMEAVVDDEGSEGALQEGRCEMCQCHKLLTFHHLIPKDAHPTYLKKRLPPGVEGEPTRGFLNTYGTMVCRQCHSFVHRLAPNEVLAKEYNTLQKILDQPSVQRWVQWASQRSA